MFPCETFMTLRSFGAHAENDRPEILDVPEKVSEGTGFSRAAIGEILLIEVQNQAVFVPHIRETKEITGVDLCFK